MFDADQNDGSNEGPFNKSRMKRALQPIIPTSLAVRPWVLQTAELVERALLKETNGSSAICVYENNALQYLQRKIMVISSEKAINVSQ